MSLRSRADNEENDSGTSTRRDILKIAGATSALSLAGCLGDGGDSTPDNGDGDSPETQTLRVSSAFSEEDIEHREGGQYMMDRLEEMTNGGLQFESFVAGELGAPDEVVSLIQNGVADIGWVVGGWHSDQLPLSQVVNIPANYDREAVRGSEAAWKIRSATEDGILHNVEYEPNDVRVVFTAITSPYQLFTRDVQIETLEDFEGLSIRTTGTIQALAMEALGASAVDLTASDIFPAMERGTVDGVLMTPSVATAYDIQQVSNQLTTNLNPGGADTLWLINSDVYDDLSTSYQDAIDEVGPDAMQNQAEALVSESEEYLEEWDGDILTTYEIPEEELSRIQQTMAPVEEEWIQRQDDPEQAQQVTDEWYAALEEVGFDTSNL